METLCTNTLLIVGEKSVHFLDLMVHFLGFIDSFHDLDEANKFNAALLLAVITVDELLYFLIWQVYFKASKQVFELTC